MVNLFNENAGTPYMIHMASLQFTGVGGGPYLDAR